MKTLIALITCLTLTAGFASADQHKKKGKNADEAQAATAQGAPQGGEKKGKKGHHQMQNAGQGGGQQGGAGAGKATFKEFTVKKQTEGKHKGGAPNLSDTSVTKQTEKHGKGQKNADLQAMKHEKKFQKKQFKLAKDKAPSDIQNVKFQQGNHIKGADHWKGNKYVVFKNYKSEWHDKDWWHHHHNKIVIVFGGPYYWDNGYWFPAWGYSSSAFFAFDGPIYAGSPSMDPGEVVANVQSALQEQGYNVGKIDGVLGPQTRAALAEYQQAQGFEPTGAIDEPTLESLGMV